MSSKIEQQFNEYLRIRTWMVGVFVDAGRAERFLAKPNNNRCPSMYKMLETYYQQEDWGYHDRPKLSLRATPKQMTRYNFAVDLLLLIKDDISENPSRDRKLMWLRANRLQWTKLGKMFGFHRTTIKKLYENILDKLSTKLKNNFDNFDKLFIY